MAGKRVTNEKRAGRNQSFVNGMRHLRGKRMPISCYLRNASVNIADGRPVGGGEVTVDTSDDLINFFLQILVLFDVRS